MNYFALKLPVAPRHPWRGDFVLYLVLMQLKSYICGAVEQLFLQIMAGYAHRRLTADYIVKISVWK